MTRYNNLKANDSIYYFAIGVTLFFSFYLIMMFSKILYHVNIDHIVVGNFSVEQVSKNIITNSLPMIKYLKKDTQMNANKAIETMDQDAKRNQDRDEEKDVSKKELDIDITKLDNSEKQIIEAYKSGDTGSIDKVINRLYLFESTVAMASKNMKLDKLLVKNMSTDLKSKNPKVLIFNTHSQEAFMDSRPGVLDDTVVGVGERLAEILKNKYQINAIYHAGKYDVVDARLHRDGSYERMEVEILKVLKENPSIEVVIDIHRDGIPDNSKLVTKVNDKATAKIMFVDGLCEKITNGQMQKIPNLPNDYLPENLAFSLKLQMEANEKYPSMMRRILIKPYRYSLFMKPKSLLVEVGAQTSTVAEAKNAMEPLAEILVNVLKK